MQQQFLKYIKNHQLFSTSDKVLLATSGGIDSRAMLHLFHSAGIQTAIVHCNFRLRGEQSEADESFVRQLAESYNMPFFVMHFNTKEYAELQKLSIQMAARELRYNWFENLRQLQGYHYIATAHNADDAIETFLINLLRGTGIQGLTGIKNRNGNIVRPLLFAFRSEIEKYCFDNKLEFRNDASNDSDNYLRNRIRHSLIPVLCELNTEFRTVMSDNLVRITDAEKIYADYLINATKNILESKEDDSLNISIKKLNESPSPKLLLFEILKNFGFSPKTTAEIFDNLDGTAGSVYYSDEKRLIKDREFLIITPIENQKESKFYINEDSNEITFPLHIKIQRILADEYSVSSSKHLAAIDADKLNFPLLVRRWQKGDYFRPLGMEGLKKLSDFFIDSKLSLADKENTWILTSAGDIAWIIGMRIDDRFKITDKTRNILLLTLEDV
jgi:tRNA(Ile)-lysidine synthase